MTTGRSSVPRSASAARAATSSRRCQARFAFCAADRAAAVEARARAAVRSVASLNSAWARSSSEWRNCPSALAAATLSHAAADKRALLGGVRQGAWSLAVEYGELVAQYEDLDVLGRVGAGEQRHPAHEVGDHESGHSQRQRMDHAVSRAGVSPQVTAVGRVSGTHSQCVAASTQQPAPLADTGWAGDVVGIECWSDRSRCGERANIDCNLRQDGSERLQLHRAPSGRRGTGQATTTSFLVPEGSLGVVRAA
jgi:hypothetical protein